MIPHPLQSVWTEKAKTAMHEKAKAGFFPGCAPVGYKNVRLQGEKAIVIDTQKSAAVKALFLAVAHGSSIRAAGRLAWSMGLRSRTGKVMGPSSLYAVLTNPFYTGMVRWRDELVQGKHKAIVSEKLFDCVQMKLPNNYNSQLT